MVDCNPAILVGRFEDEKHLVAIFRRQPCCRSDGTTQRGRRPATMAANVEASTRGIVASVCTMVDRGCSRILSHVNRQR
jgi:hypothetical protein